MSGISHPSSTDPGDSPLRERFFAGAVAAAAVGITALVPATASADDKPTLVEILLSDPAKDGTDGFDFRFWDYDIVTQALIATDDLNGLVTTASAGDPNITAFLPNDLASKRAIVELGGPWISSEKKAFEWLVANLGRPLISEVVKYHVVVAGAPS